MANPAHLPVDHPPVKFGRIGVLLLNVGTPEGTGYWSMRRYLKEFLTDRRVIEVNPIYWWVVLNTMILPHRPAVKGKAYASIWNNDRNESPLKTISRSQAEKLGAELVGVDRRIMVDWAMRYGHPSIDERLKALKEAGCDRILLAPLYPQYSAATTASACDSAFKTLMKMRWQPAIRVLPPYYDDPVYIDAVVEGMKASLAKLDLRARDHPDLVPRRAEKLPDEGRPLSLPLRQDQAADPRGAGPRHRAGDVQLPVAVRQ